MKELGLGRTALRTRRTLRIALAWVAAGVVAAFIEASILQEAGAAVQLIPRLLQHFWGGLLGGLFGGGTYIFLLRDRLRHLPYLPAVAVMSVLLLIVLVAAHAISAQFLDPLPHGSTLFDRIFSLAFLAQFLYWSLLMAATMLAVRLSDQYGSGALNYLTGRYNKPRQELRVFMFLDMRSSTAIAERLGHVRYFELLNAVYSDITDPVVYSRGEVYQYVGDEVSVSWPLHKGLKDQRCIRCFFDIRAKLAARAEEYERRFGLVPQFKAGFRYGEVTTGEVGLVKKEMIFSGDVVNTAARIQNSCNAHNVDNLISKELLDILRLPERLYNCRPIGEIPLRGKRDDVSLWTIDRQDDVEAARLAIAKPLKEGRSSSSATELVQ